MLLAAAGALSSCAPESNKPPKAICAQLGQRLGATPVKGFIFASVGTRVLLDACPNVQVRVAFIGETPPDYKQLVAVASDRLDVIAFTAVADGFVVQEGGGDPLLILISLDKLREDPGATARAQAASR
jgi:hypothetical protein